MSERDDPKGAGDPLIQHQAGVIDAILGAMHKEDKATVLEYLGLQEVEEAPPEGGATGATGATGGTLSAKKRGPERPDYR
jgi:hypothetical protein